MKKLLLSAAVSTGLLFSTATSGFTEVPQHHYYTQTSYHYYHPHVHTKRNIAIGAGGGALVGGLAGGGAGAVVGGVLGGGAGYGYSRWKRHHYRHH
jgi:outer membrane lipoprotein SlyB